MDRFRCEPARERFIPITALPFWDVEASVAEIERCARLGHKGVLFTGEPHSHGQPVLANPHWNPLWECAQALQMPISFHIGAGDFTGGNFWTPERRKHYGSGGVNGVFTVGMFLVLITVVLIAPFAILYQRHLRRASAR